MDNTSEIECISFSIREYIKVINDLTNQKTILLNKKDVDVYAVMSTENTLYYVEKSIELMIFKRDALMTTHHI